MKRTPLKRKAPLKRTGRLRPISPSANRKLEKERDHKWHDEVCGSPKRCALHSRDCWGEVWGHHVLGKQAFPQTRHDPDIGVPLCSLHHVSAHREQKLFDKWLRKSMPAKWAYCEMMKAKIKRGEM